MAEMSEDDVSALAGKLSSFMDGLSIPERELLDDLLSCALAGAQSPEVEGFGFLPSDPAQVGGNALPQFGLDAASRDRKRAGLDNIQKVLDIIRPMNPRL